MLRALLYILPLALAIYAFIDCLNTPEDEVKHLPKVAWIFIILLFWVVGPIVWLVGGKQRAAFAGGGRAPRAQWVAPDDNPEFLKSLREDRPAAGGTGDALPEDEPPAHGDEKRQDGKKQDDKGQDGKGRDGKRRDERQQDGEGGPKEV
ncbi:PLD nuclease N-terminal domain-containing protein [Streptomyces sp. NPDC015131]|uniref:PLD nuclease N-terminal domain-containing protein n=1 Tax=Streptomyces sp. NPDC015131 TaxID=3364941 RepID=UPI0036FF6F55